MIPGPLTTIPVATILVLVLAIAGAVVLVIHPATLTFDQYVKDVGVAAGGLAIGRGLDSTAKP